MHQGMQGHGARLTSEDDEVLGQMMLIETDVGDEELPDGRGCIAHDLPQGAGGVPEALRAERHQVEVLPGEREQR